MFHNDQIGDCTCAAIGHMLQAHAANAGHRLTISDDDALALYELVTGYDPAKPETDQGAMMIDVLKAVRAHGLRRHKIGAYVSVDPSRITELEAAVNLFGSAYVGVDLPIAAQHQTVWDVAPPGRHSRDYEPGSWGGHAISMLGYDDSHAIFVTWGAIKIATISWVRTYATEAWVMVDKLWIDNHGMAPSGFNAAALAADLAQLGTVR